MFAKYIDYFKMIKITDILLFVIIIFLFLITNLLFSINRTLSWTRYDVGAITSNTYGVLMLQLDNDKTDWDKTRFNNVEKKVKKLDNLMKK